MDPRGIVAASTAASFCAPLIALGIGGANRLLPATFLVIAGTVAIYGLAAAPLSRMCEPAMGAKTVMEMSSTAAARASGSAVPWHR